jgi:hypothetical protein
MCIFMQTTCRQLALVQSNQLQLNTARSRGSNVRRRDENINFPQSQFELVRTVLFQLNTSGVFESTVTTHAAKTVPACFTALRQIRRIRSSFTRPLLMPLVVAMVLSRHASLAGLPDSLGHCLQSILNTAARLVCSTQWYNHITPLLCDLHWLWQLVGT